MSFHYMVLNRICNTKWLYIPRWSLSSAVQTCAFNCLFDITTCTICCLIDFSKLRVPELNFLFLPPHNLAYPLLENDNFILPVVHADSLELSSILLFLSYSIHQLILVFLAIKYICFSSTLLQLYLQLQIYCKYICNSSIICYSGASQCKFFPWSVEESLNLSPYFHFASFYLQHNIIIP